MKRLSWILLLLFCLCLASCGLSSAEDTTDQSITTQNTMDIISTSSNELIDSSGITPPVYIYPINYSTVDEFNQSIKQDFTDEFFEMLKEMAGTDIVNKCKYAITFFSQNGVPVPSQNGELLPLRNKDDFSNISFFISEKFELPWFWYYPKVDTDENFFIRLTPLPKSIVIDDKDMYASSIIKQLSNDYPNIDNAHNFENFSSITEIEIQLYSRTVRAVYYQFVDDERDELLFVYDGCLIAVRYRPEIWNNEWFLNLSFEKQK